MTNERAMTNRQAIDLLKEVSDCDDSMYAYNPAYMIALDLAISALEKQEKDRWIPVTERLPKTTDPVNVTWTNNSPEPYYADIKGKRFTACAHYHRGRWWWYSSVCQDLLDEYGKSCMNDEVDGAIEIIAWKPIGEPYEGEEA